MSDITVNYRLLLEELAEKVSAFTTQIMMVLREDSEFLLLWILANTVAGSGIFVGIFLYNFTVYSLSHPFNPLLIILGILATGVLGVIVLAASFGVMQWLVLKRKIRRIKGIVWVLGTTLVLPLSIYVAFLSTKFLFRGILNLQPTQAYRLEYHLVYLIMIGALLGIVHWLILRRYIFQAYWWILASIFGVSIGAGVGVLIYETYIFSPPATQTDNIVFTGIFGGLVGGALFGIVTCIPLAWLLRKQIV